MTSDVLAAYHAAASERGLVLPDDLQADGELHRCAIRDGKRGNRDGAYLIHVDGIPAGGFQNWADGQGWQDWCSRSDSDLSPAERAAVRARIDTDKKRRATKLVQERAAATVKARGIWDESAPCTAHPYLSAKNAQANRLRTTTRDYDLICSDGEHTMHVSAGVLVVPLCDSDGGLHSLEFIWPDGKKRFLPGGQKQEHFHVLGDPDASKAICITEGYATGATIFEETGFATFIAFDCGNLLSVASTIRKKFSSATIIICADDDYQREGNPGVTHASKAALTIGGLLAVPAFGADRPEGATDFNDLAKYQGTAAVKAQVGALLEASQPKAVTGDAVMPPESDYGFSESEVARRFGDIIRPLGALFAVDTGVWWHHDGTRHVQDQSNVWMLAQSLKVSRAYAEDAVRFGSSDPKFQLRLAAAKTYNGLAGRKRLIELSRAEPGLTILTSQFDSDPEMFNVSNGVIDLLTFAFRPHSVTDRVTKLAPVHYDLTAIAPRWWKFLEEIQREAETRNWLQRFVGYCMTGLTKHHVAPFLWGRGHNGKSVWTETIEAMLGDYACTIPNTVLMASDHPQHSCVLMPMRGARWVKLPELKAGRLDEAQFKSLASADTQTARNICEGPVTWKPTHKIIMTGNDKPIIHGQDEGIWRRLRLVPFLESFPEGDPKCDPDLPEKLHAELSGILNWAIEGCKMWRRDGLGTCTAVTAATGEYREESDRVGPYIMESCREEGGLMVTRAALYRGYVTWAEAQHIRPMSDRDFAEAIRGRGIEECWPRVNGKQVRGWRGIGLATDYTDYTFPPDSPIDGNNQSSYRPIGENVRNVSSPVVTHDQKVLV